MMRRNTALVAALIALGMAAYPPIQHMERVPTPPETIARKRTKAEKKRAKRAARNLRISTAQPEDAA